MTEDNLTSAFFWLCLFVVAVVLTIGAFDGPL